MAPTKGKPIGKQMAGGDEGFSFKFCFLEKKRRPIRLEKKKLK